MATKLLKLKIYNYLVECAVEQRTTTYEELADVIGTPGTGNQLGAILSPLLEAVTQMEITNGHSAAPLTALVVRKSGQDEGLPGRGFWPLISVNPDRITREQKQTIIVLLHRHIYRRFEMLNDEVVPLK